MSGEFLAPAVLFLGKESGKLGRPVWNSGRKGIISFLSLGIESFLFPLHSSLLSFLTLTCYRYPLKRCEDIYTDTDVSDELATSIFREVQIFIKQLWELHTWNNVKRLSLQKVGQGGELCKQGQIINNSKKLLFFISIYAILHKHIIIILIYRLSVTTQTEGIL